MAVLRNDGMRGRLQFHDTFAVILQFRTHRWVYVVPAANSEIGVNFFNLVSLLSRERRFSIVLMQAQVHFLALGLNTLRGGLAFDPLFSGLGLGIKLFGPRLDVLHEIRLRVVKEMRLNAGRRFLENLMRREVLAIVAPMRFRRNLGFMNRLIV